MKLMLAATLLLFSSTLALAQSKAQPIEITADRTLEWHKMELQYVAHGNVVVKRGDTTIKADDMTADYHDGKGAKKSGGTDIYRLTGIGHVSIEDKGNTVVGDKVIYDMDTGLATMTGNALKMTSPEQTVTARDRFEYQVNDGKIKAIGDAKLVRGEDTLTGDTLTALLGTGKDGKRTLERLESSGNVKIVTPTETLTGRNAVYNAPTDTAIVTGSVKIVRGENTLSGGRAEVNLTTNVSRLFGSSIEDGETGGRVKGVFYPGSDKEGSSSDANH